MTAKRFASLLIFFAIAFSSLPITGLSIEYDDFENIAQKKYTEDEGVYATTYESNSVSSSDKNRWNSFYPPVYVDAIADPEDSTNKVGRFFSAGSSRSATVTATKNYLYAKEGKPLALSTDMYISLCTDGLHYPVTVAVKLSATVVLTLSYNSQSGLYDWTFGGEKSGTVAPQSWFHLSVYATPSPTDGLAQSTMSVQISGDTVKDGTGTAVGAVQESGLALAFTNTQDKGGALQISNTVPEVDGTKIPGGYYLDNTRFYIPGDFRAEVVADKYGDPSSNVDLNGNVTVKLNHDLALSSLDLAKVRLYSGTDDTDVPYTALLFDRAHPNTLTFSFAEHTLLTYTDYYVELEETVCDMGGRLIQNPVVSFTTKGEKNSRPAPEPIIEEPEGGYVMPDPYNTGYRCDESELVPFTEKYPLFTSTNVEITEALAKAYDYEFSHFTLTGAIKVTATSPVYIHDFYLDSNTYHGISNSGSARLTVAWGECINSLNAMFGGSNLTLSHIYCHDVKADHMKGASNQLVESCYFRDGGTRNHGAHADVIQISCATDAITNSIKILGNRFDIPGMAYDHAANACIFIKPEHWDGVMSQGHANIQISYNWFNGGGYTTYLTTNSTPLDRLNYLTYSYNTLGVGRAFGLLNHGGWETSDFNYIGNAEASLLEAGSVVFYDGQGNRIYKAADLTDSGEVLVNLANYSGTARTYGVMVDVVDEGGNVVKSFSAFDSIKRNMSSKEYTGADNLQSVQVQQGGQTITVQVLKENPNLPSDVPCTVALSELPDMSTHTIEVRIYDTTEGEAFIRSCVLGEDVKENTLLASTVPQTHTVTFKGKDGAVLRVQTVEHGKAATAPAAPTVSGYNFVGWSVAFDAVVADLVVQAQYEKAAGTTPDPGPTPSDPTAAFEEAVQALSVLSDATLSAKYGALVSAALAFAEIEDKEEAKAGAAYADYLVFISDYNEAVAAACADIPKPF